MLRAPTLRLGAMGVAVRAMSAPVRSALSVAPTRDTTLGSGLRVASETTPGETATVGVFIDTGSRYENEQNNGVAHFLEHMAFKGTTNRDQYKLEQEIENMGGHLNAYTSREQTVYYAKVAKKDVGKAVEILSDILQNSTLNDDAVERERSTILREMEEVEKNKEEVVFDHLHATAFQGTPLAYTILGPVENIQRISRNDLKSYIQTHYTAPRMVIAGAGAVDHDELVKLSEQHFKSLPTGSNQGNVRGKFCGSDVRVKDDTLPVAHFALAVEGVSWTSPDFFAMLVAQSIVGSWDKGTGAGQHMSSKLASIVASNHLAHSFTSFNTSYKDTGLWGVYATTTPDHLDDLVYVVEQEWIRLAFTPGDREVERAKNQLKTTMLAMLDGSTAVCEDIGRQMLTYRRRMSPAEIFARIDAVDKSSIRRVANEYIYNKSPAMAAVGPVYEMPDYNRLESWNYWIRV